MLNLPVKVVLFLCCSLCAVDRTAQAGGPDVERLPVQILLQDALCGGSRPDPAVVLVSDSGQLERIISAAKRHTIGQPPQVPAVDFTAVNVVLIRMGQRPTGGYGIEVAEPQARLDNGSALIRLRWIEPAPGTVSTQAVTSPCLIIELPKGAYRKIVITDESGKIKGEISV
ncbi:MAG: protease complex subunit PrcB family protein [Desulfobacterales bacterium]